METGRRYERRWENSGGRSLFIHIIFDLVYFDTISFVNKLGNKQINIDVEIKCNKIYTFMDTAHARCMSKMGRRQRLVTRCNKESI